MSTFALVGSGFRARMLLKVAVELGTVRCAAMVVRTPRGLDVPVFASLAECLRETSGRRWMDDEIAVATLLERMQDWVRGEASEPYPLAEASQDQQISLAIEESADQDTTVTMSREGWSSW